MKWKLIIIFVLFALCFSPLFAQTIANSFQDMTCLGNPEKQQIRSRELQKLAKADQNERRNWAHMTSQQIIAMSKNDLKRCKRVGEIFGEGRLKSSNDYAYAALIYQHGDTPDHYYQAYIWATHSAELSNNSGKHLAALAIDRYLVSIGKKQLFASQFFAAGDQGISSCYCMQSVETSFPDDFRKKYSGYSLHERYDLLASINKGRNCQNIECTNPLKESPQGTIPGLW